MRSVAAALVVVAGAALQAPQAPSRYTTWKDYGGSADSAQYSALTQIDRSNVSKLRVAWSYPTGDPGNYLFNPIVVDNVMYVLAKSNSLVALEAASGKEIWTHSFPKGRITTRGVNYWESRDRSERRLLYANNQILYAIDAKTGETIPSFGVKGGVDLREGLGRDPSKVAVQSATPGRVFEDLVILGTATNQEYDSAPGDIRAFDVRTGKVVWTFHTIPHAGDTATRRGRRMPGNRSAAPTTGRKCRWTPRAAWCSSRRAARSTTSTARIEKARISLAIA